MSYTQRFTEGAALLAAINPASYNSVQDTGFVSLANYQRAVIIIHAGVLGGDLDKWGILIAGGGMLVLIVRHWLPASFDRWILVIILAGLAGLSVYSLFAFIVPYLSP